MRRSDSTISLFLAAVLTTSCSENTQAETAPMDVGQAYQMVADMMVMEVKILEIGKGGLVKVEAIDSGGALKRGSIWWLNMNQVLLVEAIK